MHLYDLPKRETYFGALHCFIVFLSIESAHHSSQARHHFWYASQNMSSNYAGLYNFLASSPCVWYVQWIQLYQGEICRLLWEACNQLLVPRIADWSIYLFQNHKQSGSCCIPMITNHLKSKRMKDTVVSVLFRSSSGFEPQEVESVSTCLQSMEWKPHAYLLSSSRNNTGNIHQKLLGHDYWLGLCQERIQSLENDRPPMPYVALLIAT